MGLAVPAFGDLWASCGGLQIAGCELVRANVLGHVLGPFQIPPTPMENGAYVGQRAKRNLFENSASCPNCFSERQVSGQMNLMG